MRHYIWHSEYLYNILQPDEMAMTFSILDFKGLTFGETRGPNMGLVKKAVSICGNHYPERNFCTAIINTPMWFNGLYKVVALVLDPVTRKKIHVFGSGKKEEAKATKFLHEMIDPCNLPPQFGGTSCPFGESPQDIEMNQNMENVLKARGVESFKVDE